MNPAGNIPVDLLVLAMVAGFLVLRLRSILGRRTGFEGAPPAAIPRAASAAPVIDGRAEPMPLGPGRKLPDPLNPAGRAMAAMQAIDRRFDPAQFLAGAEAAFKMIVTAFAAGDRGRLRPLLTESVFASFDMAIGAREAAGDTQTTDIRSIDEAVIEQADLTGNHASIMVRFVSQQLNQTKAKDGSLVGGVESPAEHVDVWTFERDLTGSNLAWRLAAATNS
jgi:predicted lipid-binding transport protein (Tim44 family)